MRGNTAPDANEALQKLDANHRIEILITDINMPGKNGYDLADAAVKMRGLLRVLLLSGGEIEGCGYPLVRKPFLQADLKKRWRTPPAFADQRW
jgi:CheY-like chemotaxis protein